ncbi:hypothetical protein CA267_006410 [Alteromonas pelagimontana]|uniref:CdiI C-terminal domain-containing protein n=1 Tax=Alteromonas pelagimontana TaxID=1858656 RepID=A0A6M4MCQ0_9ALTE|nr:hypothetical protein CA267_006410 [Alteromonas pelagimontana]
MWTISISDSGVGKIQIDDFKESFRSDLSFWSKADYERHWSQAAKALGEGFPVVFITSITEPIISNFFRSWACYPVKGELIFQEHILFLEDLERPFDLDAPHSNVRAYESVTEDGERVSEWRTRHEI